MLTRKAALRLSIAGVITAFAGLIILALTTPSDAQERVCMPREQLLAFAAKERNEHPHGAGLVSQDMIVEFQLSEQGTWTILQTFRDGRPSCVIAYGVGWKMRPRPEEREA